MRMSDWSSDVCSSDLIAAVDPQRVREAAALDAPPSGVIAPTLDDEQVSPTPQQAFERRVRFLGEYQNAGYGQRYRALVDKVAAVEAERVPGSRALREAVEIGRAHV